MVSTSCLTQVYTLKSYPIWGVTLKPLDSEDWFHVPSHLPVTTTTITDGLDVSFSYHSLIINPCISLTFLKAHFELKRMIIAFFQISFHVEWEHVIYASCFRKVKLKNSMRSSTGIWELSMLRKPNKNCKVLTMKIAFKPVPTIWISFWRNLEILFWHICVKDLPGGISKETSN